MILHGTWTETNANNQIARKTWMNADARAQNDNGKKNVIGWVRGAQDSAAATSDANGDLESKVDGSGRRAQNSERE